MNKKLVLYILALTALGCGGGKGRYQIVATSSPPCDAYRLDTQTGEVVCIANHDSYPVDIAPAATE